MGFPGHIERFVHRQVPVVVHPKRHLGAEARLNQVECPLHRRSKVGEENTPPGLHKIIPDIRIDDIVMSSAYTGWTDSDAGDKRVRRELWTALKEFGLVLLSRAVDCSV